MKKIYTTYLLITFLLVPFIGYAQSAVLKVTLLNSDSSATEAGLVLLENTKYKTRDANNGVYTINNIKYGNYVLVTYAFGKKLKKQRIQVNSTIINKSIILESLSAEVNEVEVYTKQFENFGFDRLKGVEGTAIYEGKKTEVVVLKDITANLSTNNPRQVYAKITGLNIWESDAVGLQLGIGGRGLSPNRTANFNTRQNGYDISANALGYPESYYTPPVEALERIEIVRGAASLQYGTQFGGMLNFVFKKPPKKKVLEVNSRQTVGSFGYFGSFNSFAGTKKKFSYYTFYQYKRGNGWRPNSRFEAHTAFASFTFKQNKKLSHTLDFTFMNYLAQQPGGLTDANFRDDPRQSVRDRNWFTVNWNLLSWQVDYKISEKNILNFRTFGLLSQRKSLGNLERINVADLGRNRTLIEGNFNNIGHEGRWLHKYKINGIKNTGVLGYRLYYGRTNSLQGDGDDGSDANFNFLNRDNLEGSDYFFPNSNFAAFYENIVYVTNKFTITPGVRFEYINTKADGFFKQRVLDAAGNLIAEKRIDEQTERIRNFVITGLGLKYWLNQYVQFYANLSQNYRAINFNDLRVVNPNFIVDTAIKDERGYTFDLGIRGGKRGVFNYEVTFFLISYEDRIGQILRADQPPLFIDYRYRTNIADARNVGVELMAELDVWKVFKLRNSKTNRLSFFINTSYVNSTYINTNDRTISGSQVEMVPPIIFRTGGNFRYKNFSLSVQYSFTDKHFSDATNAVLTSSAVEGLIKSYSVVDVSASYTFKRYSLEFSANNLFNEIYFTRRAESYPGPGIIPSDGRAFYLTLGVRL